MERRPRRERILAALIILIPPLAAVLLLVPRWRAIAVRGLLAWGHAVLALAAFLWFAAVNAQRLDEGDRYADLGMLFLFVWVVSALVIPFGLAIRQLIAGGSTSAAPRPWQVALHFRSDDRSESLVRRVEQWLAEQRGVRAVDGGWIVIEPTVVDEQSMWSSLLVVRGALALLPDNDGRTMTALYRVYPPSRWPLARDFWSRAVRRQALLLAERWNAHAEPTEPPSLAPKIERALEEGLRLTWELDRLAVRGTDLMTLAGVAVVTLGLVVALGLPLFPTMDGALVGAAGLLAALSSAAIISAAWFAYRVRVSLRAFAAGSDRSPRMSLAAFLRRRPLVLLLAVTGATAFVVSLGWALSPEAPEWAAIVSVAVLVLPPLVALWLGTRLAEQ
ncbi:hypothetical protein OO015_10970 [Thermomicrobium sp. 4228-Ro]|uniref:hypothetical protein n=1 Tax=Thermomicrobium sp. 4228-Ro TaxID=2993937 RepID=UPI0022497DB6|nr:hypothetical protein [Thermomicrobium sp. 4228-Ro]MCX2728012.1 hypothetical protein [Thermomicrobium sp. 4228-Ro]